MQRFLNLLFAAALVSSLAATPAFAHAVLDHAVPGVGTTVNGSPSELRLAFSEGLVAASARVQVSAEGGGTVPTGKPALDPADPTVLHVRLGRALKPGTYTVSWHVVSVDSHRAAGTYHFTVAP